MGLIYAKYSRDRKDEYKIKTCIYDENGKKYVVKEALEESGKKHIQNIYNNYKLLNNGFNNGKIKLNKPDLIDGKLYLEYEEGQTLSSLVLKAIEKEDYKSLYEYLDIYKNILIGFDEKNIIDFYYTKEFYDFFGDEFIGLEGLKSLKISNLDINFDNIIVNNNEFTILDYEWIFNFPIPFDFILYRNINVFIDIYSRVINEKAKNIIYNYLNIPTNYMVLNNENMFKKFKFNINTCESLDESRIKENYVKSCTVLELNNIRESNDHIQVFLNDKDYSFSEDNSIIQNIISDRHIYKFDIGKYKDTKLIRIDPTNFVSKIKVYSVKVYSDDNTEKDWRLLKSNGIVIDDGCYYCLNSDPQIYIELDNDQNIKYLELDIELIERDSSNIFSFISNKYDFLTKEKEKLESLNQSHENVINSILEQNKLLNQSLNENINFIKQSEDNRKIIEENLKIIENQSYLKDKEIEILKKSMLEKESYIEKINKNKMWCLLKRIGIVKE